MVPKKIVTKTFNNSDNQTLDKNLDKTRKRKNSSSIKITRYQLLNKPKRSYLRKKPFIKWRNKRTEKELFKTIDSK